MMPPPMETRHLEVDGPLDKETSVPLGASFLSSGQFGVDLTEAGYVEEEYLVKGTAEVWTWDDSLEAIPTNERPYVTRVMVRRPLELSSFSGTVELEPHHPDYDRAMTWGALAPWILRSAHAHVGVTTDPLAAEELAKWDPKRYGELSIADPTMAFDILAQVAGAIRSGQIGIQGANMRIIGSGWSRTGTFWRTYIGEGFLERYSPMGRGAIDGCIICISSGGAQRSGYTSLREGAVLAAGDPRRKIGPHGIPIIELLSECESETHWSVLRDDSDLPRDPYRLYQVAGTSHIATGVRTLVNNKRQFVSRGWPDLPVEIVETRSDSRMDFVARAVFEAMDAWISKATPPPTSDRFSYLPEESPAPRGAMAQSRPLVRDTDGNAIGGVRTPWVDVPSASYFPHSTPAHGRCQPTPHAPYRDPALLADLIGHKVPFTTEELIRRYGSSSSYLERYNSRARELVAEGWLLSEEAEELCALEKAQIGVW